MRRGDRNRLRATSPLATAAALLALALPLAGQQARSASRLALANAPGGGAGFDRAQSTAVFIGVQQFDDTRIAAVPYAVDDAIDLASAFAESNAGLVDAKRIVLSLAGEPVKADSQQALVRLRRGGAVVVSASRAEVLRVVRTQAAAAGRDGAFLVAVASHGFSEDGVAYVLAKDSKFPDAHSAISTAGLLDVAAHTPARRTLALFDACRERVRTARANRADPASAAPLLRTMNEVEGLVVFYAAAPGQYAHDDPVRRNGVFTAAILDGLRCRAAHPNDVVTVQTLAAWVNDRVSRWIRQNRAIALRNAIQVTMDGAAREMPLASCSDRVTPRVILDGGPVNVRVAGTTIVALGADEKELWRRDVERGVVHRACADLDGDGRNEVIVAFERSIVAFDRAGDRMWSVALGASVQTFVVERLFGTAARHIVVLSNGTRVSAVSILKRDGTLYGEYIHRGPLGRVAVDRRTSRHDRRIVVTASSPELGARMRLGGDAACVFVLNPKRPRVEEWYGVLVPPSPITRLGTMDYDNDTVRDIAVSTASGAVLHLDFNGRRIAAPGASRVQFTLLAPGRR